MGGAFLCRSSRFSNEIPGLSVSYAVVFVDGIYFFQAVVEAMTIWKFPQILKYLQKFILKYVGLVFMKKIDIIRPCNNARKNSPVSLSQVYMSISK